MPNDPITDIRDPRHPLLHGTPELGRSLQPPAWAGITGLAVVILLAAIAIPPLISRGKDQRPDGSQARPPTATALPTATAPAASTPPTGGPSSHVGPSATVGGAPPIATPDRGTPRSGKGSPSPSRTTSPKANPPARFTPVTVQAENPANSLSEGALPVSCDTCDGGARVRYLGKVTVYLDTNLAGTRTVTVTYEIDGNRRIKVAINDAAPITFNTSGTDWEQPKTFSFVASIPAGRTAITFYNDEGSSPDIDKVTVS